MIAIPSKTCTVIAKFNESNWKIIPLAEHRNVPRSSGNKDAKMLSDSGEKRVEFSHKIGAITHYSCFQPHAGFRSNGYSFTKLNVPISSNFHNTHRVFRGFYVCRHWVKINIIFRKRNVLTHFVKLNLFDCKIAFEIRPRFFV